MLVMCKSWLECNCSLPTLNCHTPLSKAAACQRVSLLRSDLSWPPAAGHLRTFADYLHSQNDSLQSPKATVLKSETLDKFALSSHSWKHIILYSVYQSEWCWATRKPSTSQWQVPCKICQIGNGIPALIAKQSDNSAGVHTSLRASCLNADSALEWM